MNTIEQAREVSARLHLGASIANSRGTDKDFAVLAAAAGNTIDVLIAELEKVTIERDHANDVCDSYVAELATLKKQEPVKKVVGVGPEYRPCEHEAGEWRENEDGICVEFADGGRDCVYASSLYLAAGAQPVPAGYQLVPVEPTDKMVQASLHLDLSYMPLQEGYDRAAVYKAMLAAAPMQAQSAKPLTRSEKNRIWSSCSDATTLSARASLFGTKVEQHHGIKEQP